MAEIKLTKEDYTVGLICALPEELAAAQAMLDQEHFDLPSAIGDFNTYSLGNIGPHNIVIACLPSGRLGRAAANGVAINLMRSFPRLRFGLIVGVGGAARVVDEEPSMEIWLGDVVVSDPRGEHGGVVQYDYGRLLENSEFVQTGTLNRPPTILSTAINKLRGKASRKGYELEKHLDKMFAENARMKQKYSRPGPETDRLFQSDYRHEEGTGNCQTCSESRLVQREPRTDTEPVVHYGLIGSADRVMRDAQTRDEMYRTKGIICFEMEAAGLMNDFPCIVIRGICDYSDSHKNKRWQGYAAAVATAFAKELLLSMATSQVINTPQAAHTPAREPSSMSTEWKVIEAKIDAWNSNRREVTDDALCLRDLRVTDPRDDKHRIERYNGGLFEESFLWVLENDSYLEWKNDAERRLLHIKGPAGKGKTMVVCGIINHLHSTCGAYFFFQEADTRINTATSALRGIIFMLADANRELMQHIRTKYDSAGKALFEDTNSWVALCNILEDILRDLETKSTETVMVIDAVNECVVGRDEMLELIVHLSSNYKAKWIVSSRGGSGVHQYMRKSANCVRLSLKYNVNSISDAVGKYIDHRVALLSKNLRFDESTRALVAEHLKSHAQDTFLWVSLVCQELDRIRSQAKIIERLNHFPADLNRLYRRMMDEVLQSESAEEVRCILACTTLMYRPVTFRELRSLTGLTDEQKIGKKELKDLLGECGGFLTVRDSVIEFVHQSAREFVLQQAEADVFPKGISFADHEIYCRLVESLERILKRDVYAMDSEQNAAVYISDVRVPHVNPLDGIEYACFYWSRHLMRAAEYVRKDSAGLRILLSFLRKHLLHWIEAMSLFFGVPQLIIRLYELDCHWIIGTGENELQELIHDAHRFTLSFKQMIQKYPLQIYHSGLVFSPTDSLIKRTFSHETPNWVRVRMHAEYKWSSDITRLWSHDSEITALAYSSDGSHLACGFEDGMLELWNVISGGMQGRVNISIRQEFKALTIAENSQRRNSWPVCNQGDEDYSSASYRDSKKSNENTDDNTSSTEKNRLNSVAVLNGLAPSTTEDFQQNSENVITELAFQGGSNVLVFIVDGQRVGIWNTVTDEITRETDLDASSSPLILSANGKYMVHGIDNPYAVLYEAKPGAPHKELKRQFDYISIIKFSSDGELLATCSRKGLITTWCAATGEILGSIDQRTESIEDLSLFSGGNYLVLAYESPEKDGQIKMVELSSGQEKWSIRSGCQRLYLSPDGDSLVVVSKGHTTIYSTKNGDLVKDLNDSKSSRCAFSSDSEQLAATESGGVRLFAIHATKSDSYLGISPAKLSSVRHTYFADDCRLLAMESPGMLVEVWDLEENRMHRNRTFPECYASKVSSANNRVAYVTENSQKLSLYNLKSLHNELDFDIPESAGKVSAMGFSQDDKFLAVSTTDGSTFVWRIDSQGEEPCIANQNSGFPVKALLWASNHARLALKSGDDLVEVWDATMRRRLFYREMLTTEEVHLCMAISADGRLLVTAQSRIFEIWNVDKSKRIDRVIDRRMDVDIPEYLTMALSNDNRRLACASPSGVELWNLSDRTLLHLVEMKLPSFKKLSFSPDDSSVHLISGVLDMKEEMTPDLPTLSLGSATDIFCTDDFVFRNNKPLLWLPEAYRSSRTQYRKRKLALHHESGRIALLEFMPPEKRQRASSPDQFSPLFQTPTLTDGL